MELNELFFQNYWWFLISLLGALLVFLLFVQGGQSLLVCMAKTESEDAMLVNSLGRKWELTFTTLVVFGGAFFASFPLFYSTSFGGAYWLWMAILFCFIVQAVSYEFRSKRGNFLGKRTYDVFLFINGMFAPILLGIAVATFFTGADFSVNKQNLLDPQMPVISTWQNPAHGLEALLDYRNWLLGLTVFFLARAQAALYFMNNIDNEAIFKKAKKHLLVSGGIFVVFFLAFVAVLLLSDGYEINADGTIGTRAYKYFFNLIEMPWVAVLFIVGVVAVLYGMIRSLLAEPRRIQPDSVLSLYRRPAKFTDDLQQFVEPVHFTDHERRIAVDPVRIGIHRLCMACHERPTDH